MHTSDAYRVVCASVIYMFSRGKWFLSLFVHGQFAQEGSNRAVGLCRFFFFSFRFLSSVCSPGLDRLWRAAVAGIQAGRALGGGVEVGVRAGHCSRCFLSAGGGGGRMARGVFDNKRRAARRPLLPSSSHLPLPTRVSQCQVNMVTRRACRSAMCFQGGDWQRCAAA